MTALDAFIRSKRIESFGKATPAALERLVNEHGVYLSQDYIHFLTHCNGLSTTFDFDEVRQVGVNGALADINTFYGVDNGRDYADLLTIIPKMDRYGRELLTFAPPIAVGGDFCTFVEITEGSRLGEIMYTDGELYGHYFESAEIDWSNTPDALISTFIEHGYFMPVAPSFNALLEMYAKLV